MYVADPESKLGVQGWTTLLVLIMLGLFNTGKSIRRTLYYQYRPDNFWLKEIQPEILGFLWSAALALMIVSLFYFMTVTSNNGWINHLFPNLPYDYDAMIAFMFVAIILVKGFPVLVCVLDEWNFKTQGGDYEVFFKEAGETAKITDTDDRARQRNVKRAAYENATAKGASGNITVEEFKRRQSVYHDKNYLVKVGAFLLSLALLIFAVIILGFLGRKYSDAKSDYSYIVIFWTWLGAFVVTVFGVIYTGYTCFSKIDEKKVGTTTELIYNRSLEQQFA